MKSKDKKGYKMFIQWIIPLLSILVWFYAANTGNENTSIPSPEKVFIRALSMIQNGQLLEYIEVSVRRAMFGFFIGGSLGVLLGLMNGWWNISDIVLNKTIQILRSIPVLALISFMMISFGIGDGIKIILIALGVFFPVYLHTYQGIKSQDKGLAEMGKVYGVTGFRLFRTIVFPGTLPQIFVGVRLSLDRCG